MDMIEAARMGDAVAHTDAFWGFVVGAIAGVALGVLLAVTLPVSGPLLVIGVAGSALATGGVGAIAGYNWGLTQKNYDPIESGARTVFIGTDRKNAARATLDTLTCHSGELIAQGSLTVFVEGGPAARRTDMTECGGTIDAGWPNVFIGKEAGTYLEIEAEVSDDMLWWANAAIVVGSVMSLGVSVAAFGVLVTGVGFVASTLGGMAGKWGGGEIGSLFGPGGRVIGEFLGEQVGGVLGGAMVSPLNRGLTGIEARASRTALSRSPALSARLARAPGANPAQIGARQNVANNFYTRTNSVRPGESHADYRGRIDSHLSGIDYNHPVYVDTINPNHTLNTWNAPGATKSGNYFADQPTAPAELGIAQNINGPDGTSVPRELFTVETNQPTEALFSTSAPKLDNWSVSGTTAESIGGADQIYIPNARDKGVFVEDASGNVLGSTGQTSADYSTPGVNQNTGQTPPTHNHVPIAGDSNVIPGQGGPTFTNQGGGSNNAFVDTVTGNGNGNGNGNGSNNDGGDP